MARADSLSDGSARLVFHPVGHQRRGWAREICVRNSRNAKTLSADFGTVFPNKPLRLLGAVCEYTTSGDPVNTIISGLDGPGDIVVIPDATPEPGTLM